MSVDNNRRNKSDSDLFQQSDITVREFQKDLGNQVGSFLQDNPNAS